MKKPSEVVPEFIEELKNGPELNKEVLKYAQALEGCVRQVGMHACATIIGRGDLTNYLPMTLSKDKDTGENVRTSQYDGHYIEDVGMLKMDFLGLITLSIIHNCLLVGDHIAERLAGDGDDAVFHAEDVLGGGGAVGLDVEGPSGQVLAVEQFRFALPAGETEEEAQGHQGGQVSFHRVVKLVISTKIRKNLLN